MEFLSSGAGHPARGTLGTRRFEDPSAAHHASMPPNPEGAITMSAKPSEETDLVYLSANEARALFEARELSPVEYLQALICLTMGSHEIPADHKLDEPVIINGKSVDVL